MWLLWHFAPATMSPDAHGYVVQARLLASTGSTALRLAEPFQFVGQHWVETSDGVFRSRYPPGWPVLLALGGLALGPLLASGTVFLVYLLAARYVAEWQALLAALLMAVAPVANEHALAGDAHTAAGFFLLAGVLACSGGWYWPGGVLLGVVPTLRYPEALPVVVMLGWVGWRPRGWRVFVGAAVPVGLLLLHNAAAYGSPWSTGYSVTGEQSEFALRYLAGNAVSYVQGLFSSLGLFCGLGLVGMVAGWKRFGALFLALTVPLLVSYMAYYFGTGFENQRFFIPLYPYFLVAGVWLLSRWPPVLVALVALQAVDAGSSSAAVLAHARRSLHAALAARSLAEARVPVGGVLIADRQVAASLDAPGLWVLVAEDALVSSGAVVPGQPVPPDRGQSRAFASRYGSGGPQVLADALASGRPVFRFTLSEGASLGETDVPPMMGWGGPPLPADAHPPRMRLVRVAAP